MWQETPMTTLKSHEPTWHGLAGAFAKLNRPA